MSTAGPSASVPQGEDDATAIVDGDAVNLRVVENPAFHRVREFTVAVCGADDDIGVTVVRGGEPADGVAEDP